MRRIDQLKKRLDKLELLAKAWTDEARQASAEARRRGGGSKPSVSKLAQQTRKQFGSADCASGGRCYEFRDALHEALGKNGIKGAIKTDNTDWVGGTAKKAGVNVGWAQGTMLSDPALSHAWVYHEGKHYDALNPEGVANVHDMKYFKQSWTSDHYRPDEETQTYQKQTHGKVYNKATDEFEKPKKVRKAWTDEAREASALSRQHRGESKRHASLSQQKAKAKDWAFRDLHAKLSALHDQLADHYAHMTHKIVNSDRDPQSLLSTGRLGHPEHWSSVDPQQRPTPRL